MKYSREDLKFIAQGWWARVPAKEKWMPFLPIIKKYFLEAVNKSVPMLAIVAVRTVRWAAVRGINNLDFRLWWTDLLLVLGWILGWMLAEVDQVFYALTCDPAEATCQRVKREMTLKRWKSAWKILEETQRERRERPVRNMLTVGVLLVMGIWMATSSASFVGMGMVLGLTGRLYIEAWEGKNYSGWYWVFKREFTSGEHRIFMTIWGVLLFFLTVIIVKG